MALTYLWAGFFIVGFLAALVKFFFLGDTEVFKRIVDGTFEAARVGVMDLALPLAGVMTLWLGILAIGEKAGAIDWVARIIAPFFSRIYPSIPKNHPATGLMVMNYSANFLGLDNAATPVGLKAMAALQELNPKKDEASDAQLMFLVLQTAGLTLIPLTVMAQRAVLGAADPSDIFIPTLIATYAGTFVAFVAVALKQRINLLDPVILSWLGGLTSAVLFAVWYMSTQMTREELQTFSKVSANLILFSVIIIFLVGGLRKKINVYEAFIQGAKGGIETSIMIIPYLVGMLVAISVLRNSGVLGMIVDGFSWIFAMMGFNTDFTPALPTAIMKSVSGSGARAMMIETMKTYGVDSFVGRLVSILQGSSDTTFYIIALYFGSVGIIKTRYAISYGLLADFAGVVAAIFVAYLFFH
ncbi:MAG: nucleoside recognition domain-containing protein [Burkholderiales bacterium]